MLFRVRAHGDGHLVRPVRALHRMAVHFLGAGPALGRAEHDHRPAGAGGIAVGTGMALDALDLPDGPVQRGGHLLMHYSRLITLHKARLPAAAAEEALHLLMGHAGEDGGICDLKAVQVQDRQHRAVGNGIDELVAVPGGGQRAGLRLAVAHHAGGDQVRIVRHSTEGVSQGIPQFAALVDGAGRLRRHMTGHTAGEGELLEQLLHAVLVLGDVGIDLGIAAVQPVLSHHGVSAVAGAGAVDHVQIILLDDPVQMGIDEILSRAGAPVSHDGLLQVGSVQGPLQQRIVQQVQLACSQVVCGTPPGVNLFELCGGKGRFFGKAGTCLPIRRLFCGSRHNSSSFCSRFAHLVYRLFPKKQSVFE